MLTIEFHPPDEPEACPCCGGKTTSLTRFITRDGAAYAVYYAQFTDSHPDRVVLATVSLGDWAEEAGPEKRVAFALVLRASETEFEVEIVDADRSPWQENDLIGRTLDRAEALIHPLVKEVYHITDHIFSEDIPVFQYLNSPKRSLH